MIKIESNQKGFTMVEFLIATAVFSMVLLLCSVAVIQVGRTYFKGIITSRTQEASRRVIDEVASSIQFGPTSDTVIGFASLSADQTNSGVVSAAYCIGGIRYSFARNAVLGDANGDIGGILYSRHVLWRDRYVGSCTPANLASVTPSAGGVEMLAKGMRLPRFVVTFPGAVSGSWGIDIRVAYADDLNLFVDSNPLNACQGSGISGSFCALSEFNTSVYKRL